MPVHNWTPDFAWLFHDFRHGWLCELAHDLNRGVLPPGFYALIGPSDSGPGDNGSGGDKSQRVVTIRSDRDDRVVAVCEIVRPDYTTGEVDRGATATRAAGLFESGIHLLLVDQCSSSQDRTLVSYEAVAPPNAYIEPVAVGDVLPDMPLFLVPGGHVLIPLEQTYLAAWEGVPARCRAMIEPKPG